MIAWIKKIVRQELAILFYGKPPAVFLIFGIPILYSILFGFAYSNNVVKYIPAVVYDQDQTLASRSMVQAYMDSERYNVVAQVTTQEEMEECLRQGTALVAIVIPPKFSQNIKMGLASEVLIVTDATNLMFSNTVISSSQEIIQTIAAGTGQKLFEGYNQMPSQALRAAMPIRFSVRILNNPTSSYSNFMLAGLGANGLQLAIVIVTCTILTKEYDELERWAGCQPIVLIVGKLIPYWICGIGAFLAYIVTIVVVFGVPFRGSMLSLLLIGSAFTFAVSSVGLFFSAISFNAVMAIEAPILYIMPAFLFSGFSWPHFAMNGFSRIFSATMPLSYAADTIRDVLLAEYAPAVMKNTLILFSFGLVLLLLSAQVFSWRRHKVTAGKEMVSL